MSKEKSANQIAKVKPAVTDDVKVVLARSQEIAVATKDLIVSMADTVGLFKTLCTKVRESLYAGLSIKDCRKAMQDSGLPDSRCSEVLVVAESPDAIFNQYIESSMGLKPTLALARAVNDEEPESEDEGDSPQAQNVPPASGTDKKQFTAALHQFLKANEPLLVSLAKSYKEITFNVSLKPKVKYS